MNVYHFTPCIQVKLRTPSTLTRAIILSLWLASMSFPRSEFLPEKYRMKKYRGWYWNKEGIEYCILLIRGHVCFYKLGRHIWSEIEDEEYIILS